jgi:hypothetical protein
MPCKLKVKHVVLLLLYEADVSSQYITNTQMSY